MQTYSLNHVWNFLESLANNNNKVWFDAHKSDYKEALADFQSFTEALIVGLSRFDASISDLTVKDCTYRIYRDLRFSLDKTPYKTHMGAYVCPGGKKSWNAGYYLHIEPCAENMLVSGLFMPSPLALRSVREEIMLNGSAFDKAIKDCNGFILDITDSLKRIPNGWDATDEFSEYYKLKNFMVTETLTKKQILDPHFLDYVVSEFEKTQTFVSILNRCVSFANDSMI